jgi:signal transduction histidine kinase
MLFNDKKQIELNTKPLFPKWKILIVDDDDNVHEMISRILKDYHFDDGLLHLLHANSGEEANYLIKKHPDISVILLDVVMETDDAGLKCVKYVRNILKNDIIQIILLTGQPGQAPESTIIKDYGINDYQAKAELTSQRLNSIITIALRGFQISYSLKREILERRKIEKELMEAKEIAHSANLAKTNFLSTMSHELRTPMNGIIGVTDLLMNSIKGKENQNLLNIIYESGNSLMKIMNDILDLSRLESKQLTLEDVEINIQELCDNIKSLYLPQLKLKGLDFEFTVDKEVATEYTGDLNRLNQVLSNLISNAIKFTDEGKITLNIKLVNKVPKKSILQFDVTDTGIGIPESSFDNIFQSFTQVDGSKSRKFNGIGVGLAITKYLTDFMGGTIGIESEDGKGSLFWVKLPFRTNKL